MTDIVIGLDTSCYTTSAAAVTTEGRVIASCRKLLPVGAGERGLRQSEMVFIHVRQLPEMLTRLGEEIAGCRVAAVCASSRPRDEESSYMPVFHVGDAQARGLAAVLGVPCFASTHQRGHIAAAMVDSGARPGDLLALHLSGGTTELLAMKDDQLTLLGGTLDLHAGQLVDRTGVALGLPFPAGPHLEALARRGRAEARLPASMAEGDLRCHFSGAEAQIVRWIERKALPPEDIAMEVYDLLARTVARLLVAGAKRAGIRQALVAGGVSSSALFREELQRRVIQRDKHLHVHFGRPEYSGDNAVGAALIGAEKYRAMRGGAAC